MRGHVPTQCPTHRNNHTSLPPHPPPAHRAEFSPSINGENVLSTCLHFGARQHVPDKPCGVDQYELSREILHLDGLWHTRR
jgi:hypothetical protein